jgi:hypothetical protein
MLLFIMAFVGNSLYVLSILTNPLASYPGYLLEATPYLMGSGSSPPSSPHARNLTDWNRRRNAVVRYHDRTSRLLLLGTSFISKTTQDG